MLKNLKTGFSLVEVMILFAVLAVIMAASLPMLSTKTISPPRITQHGVYICVANGVDDKGNPKVRQEYYDATNPLGRDDTAEECTFNVPKANEYKVELYSAGAGGVEYAEISSVSGVPHSDVFNTSDMKSYFDYRNLTYLISGEISHLPTNEDFTEVFNGITVSLLNNTGSGGSGGNAVIHYHQVNEMHCVDKSNDPDGKMPIYKNAVFTYMVDKNDESNVQQQYSDYCQETFSEYYLANKDKITSTVNLGPTRDFVDFGEVGGSSKSMAIDFKIKSEQGNNSYYRGIDNRYPFLIYLSDLIHNTLGHGYFAARCTDIEKDSEGKVTIPTNPTSCTSGSPSSGANGQDADSNYSQYKPLGDYAMYLKAEDGHDSTEYAAFRIPSFSGNYSGVNNIVGNPRYNVNVGKFRTIQTDTPKGGCAAGVGYVFKSCTLTHYSELFDEDFSYEVSINNNYPDDVPMGVSKYDINYAWLLKRVKKLKKAKAAEIDEETVLSDQTNKTGAGWQYYKIYGQNLPSSDILPSATLESNLMARNYKVGKSGSNGLHKIIRPSTLGTTCTMKVPNGGPIMTYEQYEDSSWETKTEEDLAVSITCNDKEGHEVFKASLNGAQYDKTLASSTYNWTRDFGSENGRKHEAKAPDPITMTYLKPQWSKVFNKINTLSDLHVGQGGKGTTLVDRCNVPKGTFKMKSYQGNTFYKKLDDINHDGELNGVQCYPEIGTSRVLDGTINNSTGVKEEKPAIRNNIYYTLTEPTPGGPAAIVITW